jgi:ribosomal protein S27E
MPGIRTRDHEAQPRLHRLFAHLCRSCGEGNLYYDRPDTIACDHCGALCAPKALGEPVLDPLLDHES